MSRWQGIVVAVVLLIATGPAQAQGLRERLTASPAPVAMRAGGDWSVGYTVDFGYATARRPAGAAAVAAPVVATMSASTAPRPRAPSPPPSGRLHLLLLVDDTDKEAGKANKSGAASFERTIRQGIAAERLATVETISGAALTPEKIRSRITGLSLRPQDTLVAFYSGPVDYDDRVRWYSLTPGGGRISRNDLREWLFARGAALTVFLTDAPAYRIVPESLPAFEPASGPVSLQRLFFGNRGVVDVHATALGETAFARDGDGGFFTLALVDQLNRLKDDGPADWASFVDRVRDGTDRAYVDFRRAVLRSDTMPADDKRLVRDQAHQMPTALTPLARVSPVPEPAAPLSAEIVVHVPADAKVFVEDRPTKSTGPERHFETAPLQPGRTYSYSLRVLLPGDDDSEEPQSKRVTVRAGETVEVRFEHAD